MPSKRSAPLFLLVLLFGCGEDASETAVDPSDAGVTTDSAAAGDATLAPDAAPPLRLERVPGVITFSATQNGETHLYSAAIDGSQRQRLTAESGLWSYHAISPNPKYIAAVKQEDSDDRGVPLMNSAGEVWIIDVQMERAYALSPIGCNAGIGGVSWVNDGLVTFAMSCDGEPSRIYLADFSREDRELNNLLAVSEDPFPVRDVAAALNTSWVTYVMDAERCIDGQCVVKPQIWLLDTELGLKCQVTDADRDFIDVSGHASGEQRVGDHSPAFSRQLMGLVFSRNVPDKMSGPTGHHDVMRVGLNTRSFVDGDIRCEQPGTEVNLSEALSTDEISPGIFQQERFPQPAVGDQAPEGYVLYIGQVDSAPSQSQVFTMDQSGVRSAISSEAEWANYARWIVEDLELTGSRN